MMGHVHVPYARTRTYETLKSTYDVRTCVCVRSTPPVRPQNLLHPSDQAKSLLFRTSTFEEMHRQKKNAVATSTTRAADAETSSSSENCDDAFEESESEGPKPGVTAVDLTKSDDDSPSKEKVKEKKKGAVNGCEAEEPKMHRSLLFVHVGSDKSRNIKLQCVACDKVVSHSHAKEHVQAKHPRQLAEYESNMRGLKGSNSMTKYTIVQKEDPSFGTPPALLKNIARFIVVSRLALATVDSPFFRAMIASAINYGYKSGGGDKDFAIPGRRTLIDQVIEGDDGVLAETVDAAMVRMEASAKANGAALLFDGAKDACGRGLEVFMLQAGPSQALLWNGLPHDEKKSAEWMMKTIRGLIERSMNFEKMMPRDADVPTEETNTRSKKQKADMTCKLARLFDLTQYIFAAGGDNAGVPVKAVCQLEEEIAVLPFGCASHAFSRCFQHVCSIEEFDKTVITNMNLVVDLFLTRSHVREMLRMQANGRSLYRLITTRFLSAVIVAERLLSLKTAVTAVVDSVAFRDYAAHTATPLAVRTQCNAVKVIIHDELFWDWLSFFVKMSLGFVVAVRFLDGAKAGSVCLVYKMWSLLTDTVASAFKEETKNSESRIAQDPSFKTLFRAIEHLVCEDWDKFHFPVYSAGYVLTPMFHKEILELKESDPDVFKGLFDETVDCCVTVCRRFEEDGKPRKVILESSDLLVSEYREQLEGELESYFSPDGCKFVKAEDFLKKKKNPRDWWDFVCAAEHTNDDREDKVTKKVLLRMCARKITTLSPSTTPVERLHKLHKSQRTKLRNRLGYARALGLNFIAAEALSGSESSSIHWRQVLKYENRVTELATNDREFLKQIEAEADAAESEANEILEEEQLATIDAQGAIISEDSLTDQDPSTENHLGPDDEGLPEEGRQILLSSRGRVIRKKLFEGFVPN